MPALVLIPIARTAPKTSNSSKRPKPAERRSSRIAHNVRGVKLEGGRPHPSYCETLAQSPCGYGANIRFAGASAMRGRPSGTRSISASASSLSSERSFVFTHQNPCTDDSGIAPRLIIAMIDCLTNRHYRMFRARCAGTPTVSLLLQQLLQVCRSSSQLQNLQQLILQLQQWFSDAAAASTPAADS